MPDMVWRLSLKAPSALWVGKGLTGGRKGIRELCLEVKAVLPARQAGGWDQGGAMEVEKGV